MINKYMGLARELKRLRYMKLTVIPIVIKKKNTAECLEKNDRVKWRSEGDLRPSRR